MNRQPPQPLTPEERALADRLARVGPHAGPSPALDAKILGAAHAAAGGPVRARRRWLGLSSIPGSLITGVGMAASLVLAIGVVWQLRPLPALVPAAQETSTDEVFVVAQPLPSEAVRVAPAPPPAASIDDGSVPMRRPLVRPRAAPAAVSSGASSNDAAAAASNAVQAAPMSPPAAPPAPAPALLGDESAQDRASALESASEPAPAASAAAVESLPARTLMPPAPPRRRANYTTSARAVASTREQQDAARAAAVDEKRQAQNERTTLDRIEVTGSRLKTAAPTPAAEADRELAAPDWLERIREHRDAGDLDTARASLALFRETHPDLDLPDDLRALAAPAPGE